MTHSDQPLRSALNRRQFLGSSARNAAGVAAGMVGVAAAAGAAVAASQGVTSPNERVGLAVIGVRNQGKGLATALAGIPEADVRVLCDIDEGQFAGTAKALSDLNRKTPQFEKDFRRVLDDKSIHGVVIAAPDHWHAVMTILACQAGKDVYVEKPVSHNVREGERMVAAARQHKRIVQSGIQQRSGSHFASAVEFVRSGKLGEVRLAKAWTIHRRKPIGIRKVTAVPEGVDYDLWLGPAPSQPFQANRFHYNWRWFWDYGTGELGNWGVHMLDIARWGLGVGLPQRVSASGGKYVFQDDQETPDTLVVNYQYPQKTIVWEHRLWSDHGIEGRSAAAAFYGDNGTLVVDRGGWKVYDRKEPALSGGSEQLQTHLKNFVDCIKTRAVPTADIEIGVTSSALCHLGNVAYRAGREIHFDPATMTLKNDTAATALLGREYRQPWQLPTV